MTTNQKVVGSNPPGRATSSQASYRLRRLFMPSAKSHLALIPLLLLFRNGSRSLRCSLASALTTLRCATNPFRFLAQGKGPVITGITGFLLVFKRCWLWLIRARYWYSCWYSKSGYFFRLSGKKCLSGCFRIIEQPCTARRNSPSAPSDVQTFPIRQPGRPS